MNSKELVIDEVRAQWLKHLSLQEPEHFGEAMSHGYNRRLVGLDDEPMREWV